ncbi:hypothetical protein CHGG_03120 [Chaetomium globosum CBS 148.51]|uniref:AMP-dependent synthetase/ligase domain-containing protein n=1 Tax=Chaetomium globosum (strain ATCC 6205 / CBS 148.51 / DSM 1962 / NBRC 6347 / NRRL 1970) TaxID=306901 RepID=Q2H9I4_CHAGB|nr:uncharacterized protein CHGG_03120 [Chaetomium globosum CBS 148.51]EAQ91185.1 hypothetical protein CHGG_03120 [Chaetomium globosum CBS 148.51]
MTATELWKHERPEGTQMWRFLEHVNSKYNLNLKDYPQLYKWSVDNVADFWGDVWHFAGIKASKPFDQVLPSEAPMFPRPDFFAGARLNFAENLLFPANVEIDESTTAVITATENDNHLVETSWAELRDQVRRCSNALRAIGVKENSVVAGFVANHVQALVALLSAATIGAIWTGISPDNGVSAVLDRLTQIRPQVLFTDNATLYNGKEWSGKAKTLDIVEELKKHGLEQVVVIKGLENVETGLDEIREKGVQVEEFPTFLDSPFPCQPLTFFGADGDAKYRAAYFERFPGLWHHGDFVRMDPHTGGLVMLGRSDGVLKPAGVRFGSAEIYNVLTRFFAADVEDAVCVGRRRESDRDETVCLIVEVVRRELSPRHVPGVIEEAKGGVPKTGNGKKIEVAVKQILSGMQVRTNTSVANPEALDWFREWARRTEEKEALLG